MTLILNPAGNSRTYSDLRDQDQDQDQDDVRHKSFRGLALRSLLLYGLLSSPRPASNLLVEGFDTVFQSSEHLHRGGF